MSILRRIGWCTSTVALLALPAMAQIGSVLSERMLSEGPGLDLAPDDLFGCSIAVLGDLDGDGVTELAIGARGDDQGNAGAGAVWIVGLDGSGAAVGPRKIAEGAGGFGGFLATADAFGAALATVGDLDGDGIPELAVGTPGGFDVWILFLEPDGTVASERRIDGGFTASFRCEALAPLGDLDGDGNPDLAIGAPDGGTGAVWIAFLLPDGRPRNLQRIDMANGGFGGALDGGDDFGASLAPLGDLDGDGHVELAVGTRGDDDGGDAQGAVWILSLAPDGTVLSEEKISATAGAFGGALDPSDAFGSALASDDLDDDGIADLVVGAAGDDDGGDGQGAAWVLLLAADGTVRDELKISETSGSFGGDLWIRGAFGSALALLGDLDGDGVTELAVGAPDTLGVGAAWILFLGGPREPPGVATPIPAGRGVGLEGPRLIVVDDEPGPGVFTTDLQHAVDGANAGDVVLVRPGNHGALEIAGRSATLVASAPGSARIDAVAVHGLAADHAVVLRGFRTSVDLFDNAGSIWLDDCALQTSTIQACAEVGFSRTSVLGHTQSSGFCPAGGTALLVVDSTLYAYDSTIAGTPGCAAGFEDWACADGGGCQSFPGTIGADALELAGAALAFLVRTTVSGGAGGSAATYTGDCDSCPPHVDGEQGGDGAQLAAGSEVVRLEGAFQAGAGSPAGQALVGPGTVTVLPGHTCDYDVDAPSPRGTPARLEVTGEPGSHAFLTYSDVLTPQYVGALDGWSVVDPASPTIPLGTIPSSGVLQVDLPLDLLGQRRRVAVLYTQAKLYDPVTGEGALGAPSLFVQVLGTF